MTTEPLAGSTIGVAADRRADEQIELLADHRSNRVHGPTSAADDPAAVTGS